MSNRSRIDLPQRVGIVPAGIMTAVSELLYSVRILRRRARGPMRRTARRVASRVAAMTREHALAGLPRAACAMRFAQSVEQIGGRRIRKNPVRVVGDHRLPVPDSERGSRAVFDRRERLRR